MWKAAFTGRSETGSVSGRSSSQKKKSSGSSRKPEEESRRSGRSSRGSTYGDEDGTSSYATAPSSRVGEPRGLTESAVGMLENDDEGWEDEDRDARSERRSVKSEGRRHRRKSEKERSRSRSREKSGKHRKSSRRDSETGHGKSRASDAGDERAIPDMGSFEQFPGQYSHGMMGGQQEPMMSGALTNTPNNQFGLNRADSYGAAADYYQDEGQSVHQQPGFRQSTPNMLVNPDLHLIAPSATAQPVQDTGNGSAADFYSGKVSPVPIAGPQSTKPGRTSSSGKSPKPGKTSSYGTAAAVTAAGIGLGAMASNSSSYHQTQNQTSTSYQQSSSSSSKPQSRPMRQSSEPVTSASANAYYGPPPQQGSNSGPSGAAAAGLAAYEMNQHHQRNEGTPSVSPYGGNGYAHPPLYHQQQGRQANGNMQQQHFHEHKGPLTRLKDGLFNIISSEEDTIKMEMYTEYIGVCKDCFDPRSSPYDAPRRHHYHSHTQRDSFEDLRKRRSLDKMRRNSREQLGRNGSTRVNKDSRYYNDRRKSGSKTDLVGAGLAVAGVAGVAAGANALFNSDGKNFDDTYSVKSGHRESSAARRRSRSSSREKRCRSSHGVVARDSRDEYVSVRGKDGRMERRKVHRSRSGSRDRTSAILGTAAGAALGASAIPAAGRSRRSREHSPNGTFVRRRSRSRSSSGSNRGGILGGFFSPPRRKCRGSRPERRKKERGFFSFGKDSSASSDSELAFGVSRTDLPLRRKSPTKSIGKRKNSNDHIAATVAGIGATAAALAAAQNRHKLGKRSSRPELGPGQDAKKRQIARNQGKQAASEEEWEDELPSDVNDASSGSDLAFGDYDRKLSRQQSRESLGSQSSGAGGLSAWGWRWGGKDKKKRRRASPQPPVYPPRPDQPGFGTMATGIAAGTLAGAAFDSASRPVRRDSNYTSTPSTPQSMQYVDPRPLSDAGSLPGSRHASIPGAFDAPYTAAARPGIAPLQPKPITPIKPSFTQDTRDFDADHRPVPHRTQSSPVQQSSWGKDAALIGAAAVGTAALIASQGRKPKDVRFGFTEEQERRHEDERRKEQQRVDEERRRVDRTRALKEEAARQTREQDVLRQRAEENNRAAQVELEGQRAVQREADEQAEMDRRREGERVEREERSKRERREGEERTKREREERERQVRESRGRAEAYNREQVRLREEARLSAEIERKKRELVEQQRRDHDRRTQERRQLEREEEQKSKSSSMPWGAVAAGAAAAGIGAVALAEHERNKDEEREPRTAGRVGSRQAFVAEEVRPKDTREVNVATEEVFNDPEYFKRQRSRSPAEYARHIDDLARKAADKVQSANSVVSENEAYYATPAQSQAEFFAPKEILAQPSKGKTKVTDPVGDNEVQIHNAADVNFRQEFETSWGGTFARPHVHAPRGVPKLDLITPTPPPDAVSKSRRASTPLSQVCDADPRAEEGGKKSARSRSISWGADQTHVYDVPTPDSHYERDSYIDSRDIAAGAGVAAAGVAAAAVAGAAFDEVVVEPADEKGRRTYRAEDLVRDAKAGSRWEEEAKPFYRQPFYDSVSDIGFNGFKVDSPGTEGAPPVRGFVEGETEEPTPASERVPHIPGGFDDDEEDGKAYVRDTMSSTTARNVPVESSTPTAESSWEPPVSKKDKKKREKAAQQSSTLDSIPTTTTAFPDSDTVSREAPAQPEDDLDYFMSKKDKKKRGKSSATPVEVETSSREVSAVPEGDFGLPSSKKDKKKRDKTPATFEDVPTTSRQGSVAPEDDFDFATSKKDKKKREKASTTFDDAEAPSRGTSVPPEDIFDYATSKKDKKKREKSTVPVDDAKTTSREASVAPEDDFDFPLSKKDKKKREKASMSTPPSVEVEETFIPPSLIESSREAEAEPAWEAPLSKKDKKKREKESKQQGFADVAGAVMTAGGIAAVSSVVADENSDPSSSSKKGKKSKKSREVERDMRDIEPVDQSKNYESSAMPGGWDSEAPEKNAETPVEAIDPFQFQVHDDDTTPAPSREVDIAAEFAEPKNSKKKSKRESLKYNEPPVSSPLRSEVEVYDYIGGPANAPAPPAMNGYNATTAEQPLQPTTTYTERVVLPSGYAVDEQPLTTALPESPEDIDQPREDGAVGDRSYYDEPEGYQDSQPVVASDSVDPYESVRRSKRRSRHEDDDTASVVSSRSRREKDEPSSKEKKGGFFGMFSRKSVDNGSRSEDAPLSRTSTKDSKEDVDDGERKHRRRKHRGSEYGDDDDTRSVASTSSRKHRSHSEKGEDSQERDRSSRHGDADNETRNGEDGHRHHRRRRTDEIDYDDSHETSSHRHHRSRTDDDVSEKDQSFLGMRVEDMPPLPDSRRESLDSATQELGQGHGILALADPDSQAPSRDLADVNRPSRDETANVHSSDGVLTTSDAHDDTLKRLSWADEAEYFPALPDSRPGSPTVEAEIDTLQRPSALQKSTSTTAVPLRFPFGPQPVTPSPRMERAVSFGGSLPSTPATPVSAQKARQGRPASTEIRPLYLVERNRKIPEVEETLPSLPSSKQSSRASSMVGSDEYESAAEDFGTPERKRALTIDTAHANNEWPDWQGEDYLDSQQTTPRATHAPEPIFDRPTRSEPQFYTWEDYARDERLHGAAPTPSDAGSDSRAISTGLNSESEVEGYFPPLESSNVVPFDNELPPPPPSRPDSRTRDRKPSADVKSLAAVAALGGAAVLGYHALKLDHELEDPHGSSLPVSRNLETAIREDRDSPDVSEQAPDAVNNPASSAGEPSKKKSRKESKKTSKKGKKSKQAIEESDTIPPPSLAQRDANVTLSEEALMEEGQLSRQLGLTVEPPHAQQNELDRFVEAEEQMEADHAALNDLGKLTTNVEAPHTTSGTLPSTDVGSYDSSPLLAQHPETIEDPPADNGRDFAPLVSMAGPDTDMIADEQRDYPPADNVVITTPVDDLDEFMDAEERMEMGQNSLPKLEPSDNVPANEGLGSAPLPVSASELYQSLPVENLSTHEAGFTSTDLPTEQVSAARETEPEREVAPNEYAEIQTPLGLLDLMSRKRSKKVKKQKAAAILTVDEPTGLGVEDSSQGIEDLPSEDKPEFQPTGLVEPSEPTLLTVFENTDHEKLGLSNAVRQISGSQPRGLKAEPMVTTSASPTLAHAEFDSAGSSAAQRLSMNLEDSPTADLSSADIEAASTLMPEDREQFYQPSTAEQPTQQAEEEEQWETRPVVSRKKSKKDKKKQKSNVQEVQQTTDVEPEQAPELENKLEIASEAADPVNNTVPSPNSREIDESVLHDADVAVENDNVLPAGFTSTAPEDIALPPEDGLDLETAWGRLSPEAVIESDPLTPVPYDVDPTSFDNVADSQAENTMADITGIGDEHREIDPITDPSTADEQSLSMGDALAMQQLPASVLVGTEEVERNVASEGDIETGTLTETNEAPVDEAEPDFTWTSSSKKKGKKGKKVKSVIREEESVALPELAPPSDIETAAIITPVPEENEIQVEDEAQPADEQTPLEEDFNWMPLPKKKGKKGKKSKEEQPTTPFEDPQPAVRDLADTSMITRDGLSDDAPIDEDANVAGDHFEPAQDPEPDPEPDFVWTAPSKKKGKKGKKQEQPTTAYDDPDPTARDFGDITTVPQNGDDLPIDTSAGEDVTGAGLDTQPTQEIGPAPDVDWMASSKKKGKKAKKSKALNVTEEAPMESSGLLDAAKRSVADTTVVSHNQEDVLADEQPSALLDVSGADDQPMPAQEVDPGFDWPTSSKKKAKKGKKTTMPVGVEQESSKSSGFPEAVEESLADATTTSPSHDDVPTIDLSSIMREVPVAIDEPLPSQEPEPDFDWPVSSKKKGKQGKNTAVKTQEEPMELPQDSRMVERDLAVSTDMAQDQDDLPAIEPSRSSQEVVRAEDEPLPAQEPESEFDWPVSSKKKGKKSKESETVAQPEMAAATPVDLGVIEGSVSDILPGDIEGDREVNSTDDRSLEVSMPADEAFPPSEPAAEPELEPESEFTWAAPSKKKGKKGKKSKLADLPEESTAPIVDSEVSKGSTTDAFPDSTADVRAVNEISDIPTVVSATTEKTLPAQEPTPGPEPEPEAEFARAAPSKKKAKKAKKGKVLDMSEEPAASPYVTVEDDATGGSAAAEDLKTTEPADTTVNVDDYWSQTPASKEKGKKGKKGGMQWLPVEESGELAPEHAVPIEQSYDDTKMDMDDISFATQPAEPDMSEAQHSMGDEVVTPEPNQTSTAELHGEEALHSAGSSADMSMDNDRGLANVESDVVLPATTVSNPDVALPPGLAAAESVLKAPSWTESQDFERSPAANDQDRQSHGTEASAPDKIADEYASPAEPLVDDGSLDATTVATEVKLPDSPVDEQHNDFLDDAAVYDTNAALNESLRAAPEREVDQVKAASDTVEQSHDRGLAERPAQDSSPETDTNLSQPQYVTSMTADMPVAQSQESADERSAVPPTSNDLELEGNADDSPWGFTSSKSSKKGKKAKKSKPAPAEPDYVPDALPGDEVEISAPDESAADPPMAQLTNDTEAAEPEADAEAFEPWPSSAMGKKSKKAKKSAPQTLREVDMPNVLITPDEAGPLAADASMETAQTTGSEPVDVWSVPMKPKKGKKSKKSTLQPEETGESDVLDRSAITRDDELSSDAIIDPGSLAADPADPQSEDKWKAPMKGKKAKKSKKSKWDAFDSSLMEESAEVETSSRDALEPSDNTGSVGDPETMDQDQTTANVIAEQSVQELDRPLSSWRQSTSVSLLPPLPESPLVRDTPEIDFDRASENAVDDSVSSRLAKEDHSLPTDFEQEEGLYLRSADPDADGTPNAVDAESTTAVRDAGVMDLDEAANVALPDDKGSDLEQLEGGDAVQAQITEASSLVDPHMTTAEHVVTAPPAQEQRDIDFTTDVADALANSGFNLSEFVNDTVFQRRTSPVAMTGEADPKEVFTTASKKNKKGKKDKKDLTSMEQGSTETSSAPAPTRSPELDRPEAQVPTQPADDFSETVEKTLAGTGFDTALLQQAAESSNEASTNDLAGDNPDYSFTTSKRKKGKKSKKSTPYDFDSAPLQDIQLGQDSSEADKALDNVAITSVMDIEADRGTDNEDSSTRPAVGGKANGDVTPEEPRPASSNDVDVHTAIPSTHPEDGFQDIDNQTSHFAIAGDREMDVDEMDRAYKAFKKNKKKKKQKATSSEPRDEPIPWKDAATDPEELKAPEAVGLRDSQPQSVARDNSETPEHLHQSLEAVHDSEVPAGVPDTEGLQRKSLADGREPHLGTTYVPGRTTIDDEQNAAHAGLPSGEHLTESREDAASGLSHYVAAAAGLSTAAAAAAGLEHVLRSVPSQGGEESRQSASDNARSIQQGHGNRREPGTANRPWSFKNPGGEGEPLPESPLLGHKPHEIARDSGYQEPSSPVTQSQSFGRTSQESPVVRAMTSHESLSSRRSAEPLRISTETGYGWDLSVPKNRETNPNKTASNTLHARTPSREVDNTPLESTTKNRASYLFQSTPEILRDLPQSGSPTPSERTLPAGYFPTTTPRTPSQPSADQHESYIREPERMAFSPPPSGTMSPRIPLDTIPEEHHAQKRTLAETGLVQPDNNKSTRRTQTPQSIRERERALSPTAVSSLTTPSGAGRSTSNPPSTNEVIHNSASPAVQEDNGVSNIDRFLTRKRSRPVSVDHRSASVMSNGSNASAGQIRSPEDVRSYSRTSNRSSTPTLRRISLSGDLRAASRASRRGDAGSAVGARSSPRTIPFEAPPTPPSYDDEVMDGSASRDVDMSDVYVRSTTCVEDKHQADDLLQQGIGDAHASQVSPTRPPSMRKRQSTHIMELESRLDQLAAENQILHESGQGNFSNEPGAGSSRDQLIEEKDDEINRIKAMLEPMQDEISRLNEMNAELAEVNRNLVDGGNERYLQLEQEHAHAHEQLQNTSRELVSVREEHGRLNVGMREIVEAEIATNLVAKNAEIRQLREELDVASEKIRALQMQVQSTRGRDFLTTRDEDYFDGACQKLCQHVQQWVLRFSKSSDKLMCRLSTDLNDDAIEARLDNAILDGSDVDKLLCDRIKRRDVFMSVVMTMVWEYIFTRYLFGMEREQRQKLKALEKLLAEVGPPRAVAQWRATTLTLLSKRPAFAETKAKDTEAVATDIFGKLCALLPPPSSVKDTLMTSLLKVISVAVDLSVEMRIQRAEYIMLPPLQPEYDTNGDLVRKVTFNASLMNERSGMFSSNEELEETHAVVKIVLFPLVVKKGDEVGEGEEEIVVCPAQVLVHNDNNKGKKIVRVQSGAMEIDDPRRSRESLISVQGSMAF
ncbi:hypothetical protein LTR09_001398 [Extremus antarcticus]|uniref:Involucrin repeat protein n=1 Tax=Extremus antarcticus TaxID=702011 RepID=A0AAJ0GIU4_9PEZI|nr:hypothetical protein LTR09_001398 [Extremus antarcticus]